MWVVYPPSWLQFWVEHLHCNGHSAGFRIECLGTLPLLVQPWRLQPLQSA